MSENQRAGGLVDLRIDPPPKVQAPPWHIKILTDNPEREATHYLQPELIMQIKKGRAIQSKHIWEIRFGMVSIALYSLVYRSSCDP